MRISLFIYRFLIIGLILLGLTVFAGTIYGVFFLDNGSAAPIYSPVETSGITRHTFMGIGRMRVSTSDPNPGVVIIFVSFIYDPDDRPFFEELALKIVDFRSIITDYIGSFSVAELHDKDEEDIKTELIQRFNAILRLGQVETLFFSDFMIL